MIGIQLLNPIHNRSTEEIIVRDAHSPSGVALGAAWNVKRDLTIFPAASSSYGIIIDYDSGVDALGGCVLVLSSVQSESQSKFAWLQFQTFNCSYFLLSTSIYLKVYHGLCFVTFSSHS